MTGEYRFDQIAIVGTEKKKPTDADKNNYIGLEHLSPETFDVVDYGSEVAPKGEKLVMRKGDVLFGKRRAYQKKVGIAPCDGIFSAHGMVLRPNEDVVDARFFPFFIKSDVFLDEAIRISVGSLSPTVNWRDLRELKFNLPSLDHQHEVAELLWAGENLKTTYRRLLSACGEQVKSRFIEMFGSSEAGYTVELRKLGEMLDVEPQNGLYKPQSYYTDGDDGTPIVRVDAFQAGYIEDYAALKRLRCTEEEVSTYGLTENDIVINRVNGSIERVGKIAWIQGLQEETVFESNMMRFHVDERVVNLAFITAFLNSDDARHQIKACAHVANQCSINQRNVMNLKIPRPPLALQQEFADFVQRVDKSEFALKQAIDSVSATMTSILNQELGMSDV